MAELQPTEGHTNGGGAMVVASAEKVGTKRQRRPSVRLGDIGGDQSYDSHRRTNKHHWKQLPPNKDTSKSSSKSRTLMNLSGPEYHETLDGEEKEANLDSVAIGSWKVRDSKSKRSSMSTTKRVRSNWVSKMDDGGGGGEGEEVERFSDGEDADDGFGDFNSESPVRVNSPVSDNLAITNHEQDGAHYRRGRSRGRVSEGGDGPSDTDTRNWNNDNNNACNVESDGVKDWLDELGLGRYAPIFEIHEVDDEVLPLLTLEDLKDMGINAVGSRRKMYSSIQKLGKSFS